MGALRVVALLVVSADELPHMFLASSPSWNRIVLKYFNKDALDLIARGRRWARGGGRGTRRRAPGSTASGLGVQDGHRAAGRS